MQRRERDLLLLAEAFQARSAAVALPQQSDDLFWFVSLLPHSSRTWLSKSSHFTWAGLIGGGQTGLTAGFGPPCSLRDSENQRTPRWTPGSGASALKIKRFFGESDSGFGLKCGMGI